MPSEASLVRRRARIGAPFDEDAAAIRRVDAGDHVDQRSLAGAVRTDDGGDRAIGEGEIDVAQRRDAAEAES